MTIVLQLLGNGQDYAHVDLHGHRCRRLGLLRPRLRRMSSLDAHMQHTHTYTHTPHSANVQLALNARLTVRVFRWA